MDSQTADNIELLSDSIQLHYENQYSVMANLVDQFLREDIDKQELAYLYDASVEDHHNWVKRTQALMWSHKTRAILPARIRHWYIRHAG